MKRKCDEVFCKFNDLTKSIEYFYKKHNSAFTVAELVVTILVLAFLVFVLLGFMNRNQQKEYDAKNDKTVANIHALIDKASITRTGNPVLRNDVSDIQSIITTANNNGLNITDSNCGAACWGADDNETPGAAAGRHILLNDQTSIAFAQANGRIYIDANGAKGPNILGKDIKEFQYETLARTTSTFGVSPSGGCTLTVSACSTQGKIFDSVNCQCVDDSCSLTSEICAAEGKIFDSAKCTCVDSSLSCPADKVKRGNDCCDNIGSNEIWTAETGCDKCASNKWRNKTCCSTTNDSNPENSTWNSTGCGWICNALGANQVWTDESKCEYCTRGNIPDNATWGSGKDACNWSCNALGANQVWENKEKCINCTRDNSKLVANSSWGEENTANACNPVCKTGADNSTYDKNYYKVNSKGEVEKDSNGKEILKITDMVLTTPELSNNCSYRYNCPTDKPVLRTTACCPSLVSGEYRTAKTGCGTCKRGTKRNDQVWGAEETEKACTPTCPTGKVDRTTACCPSLVSGEYRTAKTGCGTCKRGTKRNDQVWGAEETEKACTPTCPTDKVDRTTACCGKLGTKEKWTSTEGCGKCKRGKIRNDQVWGAENTSKVCTPTCPADKVDRTTKCCDKLPNNNWKWTAKKGCGSCERKGKLSSVKTWGDEGTGKACTQICLKKYNKKVYVIVDASPSGAHDVVNNLFEVLHSRAYGAGTPLNADEKKEYKALWSKIIKKDPTYNDENKHTGRFIYIVDEDGTILDKISFTHGDIDNNNLIKILKNKGIKKTGKETTMGSGLGRYGGNSKLTGTYKIKIDGCSFTVPVMGFYSTSSPLVLDLMDDGFEFTSAEDGVMFDIDADGKIDKVAWTTRQTKFDNAFLVLDKNNNGQVDNGSELFGDQNGAETGFGELAKYDDNGDKLITKADAIFDKLRLWVDFNKDAHVDKGEWKTLEEAGITELSTEYKVETDADGNVKTDSHGNKVGFVGWFKQRVETVVNGVKTFVEKVKTMIDVFFQFK